MADSSQRRKGRGRAIPALNMAIDALNLAKDATSIIPVNPVFGSVVTLLNMIRVSSLSFLDEIFQAHTQSGHDGERARLCGSRAVLRQYL